MKTDAQYARVITLAARSGLTACGFVQSGLESFKRHDSDSFQQAAFNRRKVRGQDECWVAVGIGIGFKSLAKIMKASCYDVKPSVREPGIMGTDLGHLMPKRNFHEWHLHPDADAEAIGREIQEALTKHAVPFFEHTKSLANVIVMWETGNHYNLCSRVDFYLALAYWLRGDQELAMAFLSRRMEHFQQNYARQFYRRRDGVSPDARQRKEFLAWLQASGTWAPRSGDAK